MVHPEGTDNHDGERTAAQRCMAPWRQDHPPLQGIVTDDRLRSQAPPLEVLPDHDRHDMLGVQAGDHAVLFEPGQAAEPAGGVTSDARHDRAAGVVHRVRVVHDVPLHASNPDVPVHCIASWERGQAKVQPCSGVTARRVSTRHVDRLMRGGRARWKIAHETGKTLTHQGDNVEHHDGHGEPHRSVVLAMVMRLAFVVDQTPQRCGAWFQAVWAKLGRKRRLWERRRAWFDDDALASRRQLCEALW